MFLPWSEDQSSHPHKATSKVIILFSFKFMGFMKNSKINISGRHEDEGNCLLGCCKVMVEVVSTAETSVNFQQITWLNSPQEESSCRR
jgi:hypothetical protein